MAAQRGQGRRKQPRAAGQKILAVYVDGGNVRNEPGNGTKKMGRGAGKKWNLIYLQATTPAAATT
jgi:hypothetical protein